MLAYYELMQILLLLIKTHTNLLKQPRSNRLLMLMSRSDLQQSPMMRMAIIR